MASTVKVLVSAKQLENAQTTQYTAVKCTAIIDKATVTNTSAGNVSFSCNIVPGTGTPGDGNLIIKTQTITPNEVYPCPELIGHSLEVDAKLSTLSSAASALTFRVSGREIT